MPLDDVEIAWVRFVAVRDQLIAARDDENSRRTKVILPPFTGDAPAVIDLRDGVVNRRRPGSRKD